MTTKKPKTDRENKDQPFTVMVQPTLHELFKKKCEENYRTPSDVIRDFMARYVKGDC